MKKKAKIRVPVRVRTQRRVFWRSWVSCSLCMGAHEVTREGASGQPGSNTPHFSAQRYRISPKPRRIRSGALLAAHHA